LVERYLAKVVVAGSTPVSRFYFSWVEPKGVWGKSNVPHVLGVTANEESVIGAKPL
jgi:hypothetical protein